MARRGQGREAPQPVASHSTTISKKIGNHSPSLAQLARDDFPQVALAVLD